MSHIALERGLKILHHLVQYKTARFKDLTELLDPISPASQMRLLRTLTELGEVEKVNNYYQLSANSVFRTAASPHPFALRLEVDAELDGIVRELARDTSYSAALFGWITPGSIIILNTYSPIGRSIKYRPAGEEWPLIPFHDFAQLFLAYAPGFVREDAFFRWNPYLKEEYKSLDYQAFIKRLNNIREQGFTISELAGETFGSIVNPVVLHGENPPRFAVGVLVTDKPDEKEQGQILDRVSQASDKIAEILRDHISPMQLELDLSHSQEVVQQYVDPYRSN